MASSAKIFKVQTEAKSDGSYEFSAGWHRLVMDTGGKAPNATAMNPVELFLSALAGCLGITMRALADKRGIALGDFKIDIEGERFGDIESSRVQQIRTRVTVAKGSDTEAIKELVHDAERHCTVRESVIAAPEFREPIVEEI